MEKRIIITNPNTEVIIEDNVVLGSRIKIGGNCKKVTLGYGAFIGDDVYIDSLELNVGEYTSIHKNTTIHGYKKCVIGNNCWIGQNCIIDSIGGTTIGNNVGIGAYSQLWTHIKFGDTLEGCRWNKVSELIVEDDVWFVGHCIVSPITAKTRSMLMVGSVATKDMEANHIYAGSPAKDLTDKLGNQFIEKSIEQKKFDLENLYKEFLNINSIDGDVFSIKIVNDLEQYININSEKVTIFFIKQRSYLPIRTEWEYKFMKYLLYDKAKFMPMKNNFN